MRTYIICMLMLVAKLSTAQENNINKAINQYDYELAIKLIDKEKANTELTILKAKCLKNILKYDAATQLLTDLVKTDSLNIRALSELADCNISTGNYINARKIYTQCLNIEPNNKYFQINYINLLYKLHTWNETITAINKTFSSDTVPELYSLMGDCYWQQDKNDSAVCFYKKAIKFRPTDYNTSYKLAKIHLQTQKYQELVNVTNNYIRIDSTNKSINQYNGIGYCFIQEFDKAIYQLRKVYNEGDKTFTTNYFLGASLFGIQDYYSACDYLNEAYEKDSSNINLIYYLGRSLILTGNFQRGTVVLQHGLEVMTPNDSILYNYHNSLSTAYTRWAKPQEAINELEICLKLKPNNKLSIYSIANLYDNTLKNRKMAAKYYNMFLATFPKEPANENKEEYLNAMSGTYYSAVKNRLEELKNEEFFDKKK